MKKSLFYFAAIAALMVSAGCNDDIVEQVETEMDVNRVSFTVDDFEWADQTKTTAQRKDNGGVEFKWGAKDTVGIFPDSGAQAYFPIVQGAGTGEAVFNGGGWALKTGNTYAAYYPYDRFNFDGDDIPISYYNQCQVGNDNLDNLTKCDHLVSQMAVPENGEVSFQFHHLAALVKFTLQIPEADSFTKLTLFPGRGLPLDQRLDLISGDEPTVSTMYSSTAFFMDLKDISTYGPGTVTVYALLPPVDLSNCMMTIVLQTPIPAITYSGTVMGKKLEAGKAYGFETAMSKSFTPQYVDLGLNVRWATCNVGATRPEGYGDYFAWGETSTKNTSQFTWESYLLCKGSNKTLLKYCYYSEYGYNSYKDSRKTLESADDAATVNWGPDWRMPTDKEIKELVTKCTWTEKTVNGVKGYEVSGNGNSIFLPAGGYIFDGKLQGVGTLGRYWSSSIETDENTVLYDYTVDPSFAFELAYNISKDPGYLCTSRCCGCSVRPVYK